MSALDLLSLVRRETNLLGTSIHEDIDSLVIAIRTLIDVLPKPGIFLKSFNNNLSSNVADAVIILKGPKIPSGHKATVKDFNVNFTTVAGTIRLVIIDGSDNILIDVLRSINSSTNGTGATVLEENQALAIVGQTAGAGVFSVYCSGDQQKLK